VKALPDMLTTETPGLPKKAGLARPLIFLALIAAIIIIVRVFHLHEYVDESRLRRIIAGYGMWGPAIYLLVWILAPPLFLPGLPITLAGGVLFGPLWGFIYTAIGAPIGAVLAFLVARYLVRDWVAHKISNTRLSHLDEKVAQQGWKVVLFTRVVPVFPFFIINYAFGLTRVGLLPFFLATLFGMMPWSFAFVYFSSSVLDLFRGKLSRQLIIGVILVIIVSLIPWCYKKFFARKGDELDL
jgi:uncharacterized membrane protein YdjX (TVP38/TMEM64 family)